MTKKKKMTPAQAAAARHEQTPESIKREKTREHARQIKKSAMNAQKKASETNTFRFVFPFLMFAAIVLLALVVMFALGVFAAR